MSRFPRGFAARFAMQNLPPKPRSLKPQSTQVEFYEGLVRKTASLYEPRCEEDYDDLCSLFRIKAWRALESFDQAKSNVPIERYVFSCMVNLGKDLLKKKKRNEAYIEDYTSRYGEAADGPNDAFVERYLCQDEAEAFAEVCTELPVIPSTLDAIELQVVALLYCDHGHAEIALRLAITKREVAASVKSIKEKMADWRPSPRPLPAALATPGLPQKTRLAA